MAIARKPKPSDTPSKKDEVDVDALIRKGGSVAQSEKPEKTETVKKEASLKLIETEKIAEQKATLDKQEIRVNLRMPADMLEQVDKAVKARPLKIPRHTWLLEAVMEKLVREKLRD